LPSRAHGADPNARPSLRTSIHSDRVHEYRDVTPLSWGERFHDPELVSRPAMLVAQHGGHRDRSTVTRRGGSGVIHTRDAESTVV
jgi:hypothetical protein